MLKPPELRAVTVMRNKGEAYIDLRRQPANAKAREFIEQGKKGNNIWPHNPLWAPNPEHSGQPDANTCRWVGGKNQPARD